MSTQPPEAKKESPTITLDGFCCALTGKPMQVPVILDNGLSYEEEVVKECLDNKREADPALLAQFKAFPPQKNTFLIRALVSTKNLLDQLQAVVKELTSVQRQYRQQSAELEKLDMQLSILAKASSDPTTAKDSKNLPAKKSGKKKKPSLVEPRAEEDTDSLALAAIRQHMDEDPLGGFECVIHLRGMTDPMFCMDGASYDNGVILQIIADKNSLWTLQALADKRYFPNHHLKRAIEDYPKKLLQLERAKTELESLTAQVVQQQQAIVDKRAALPSIDQALSPLILEILKSDYSPKLEQLLLSKKDIAVKLSGYSLAECIALYAPWSTTQKTEFLKKLAARGIKLSPLFFAATLGLEKMFQAEVSKRGSSLFDGHGCHVLHYAVANGHKNIAQLLLSQARFALSVSVSNDAGDTAIMFAAQNGRIEMLAWLVSKYQAAINEQNKSGQDARFKAEQACQTAILDWLKQQGAKPAEQKKTYTPRDPSPYRQATPGAAPSSETPQGSGLSPYRQADQHSSVDVYAYLGIDPAAVLTTAAGRKIFGVSQPVKESKRITTKAAPKKEIPADSSAVTVEYISMLLALDNIGQHCSLLQQTGQARGAGKNEADVVSAVGRDKEVVDVLLLQLSKFGPEEIMRPQPAGAREGQNALFIAVAGGNHGLVKTLLRVLAKAGPKAILTPQAAGSRQGQDALHLAAECGNKAIVETFLGVLGAVGREAILRPQGEGPYHGVNALSIASRCGHEELAAMFWAISKQEHAADPEQHRTLKKYPALALIRPRSEVPPSRSEQQLTILSDPKQRSEASIEPPPTKPLSAPSATGVKLMPTASSSQSTAIRFFPTVAPGVFEVRTSETSEDFTSGLGSK